MDANILLLASQVNDRQRPAQRDPPLELEVISCVYGVISPLRANIYLHYVFDLWVQRWRRDANGDVIVVRYADDSVAGFESKADVGRFP